jgi:DNA repair protein RadD
MILRDYQVKFLSNISKAHKEGHQGVIGEMPTGAGKTVCMARIARSIAERSGNALIVVHRAELLSQTADKLTLFGVPFGVIHAKSENPRPNAPVQIAMVQTLARRIKANKHFDFNFHYIIFDECHLAAAASYVAIINRWPNARRLGLSATPYRLDGRGLSEVGTIVVKGPSVQELIDIGSLVPFTTYSPIVADLSRVKKVAGEYDLSQQADEYKKADVIGDVIKCYNNLANGRPFIAFCATVEHSILTKDRFCDEGLRVEHIDGTTPLDERNLIIYKLNAGIIDGVTNCGCLTEGFDCPRVSCVMVIRKTASPALWRQMGGRCLRPFKNKTNAVILDFGANAENHGNFGYIQQYTLEGSPKKSGEKLCRICPKCAGVCAITQLVCHVCSYDFTFVDSKERTVIEVDGELSAIEFDMAPVEVKPKSTDKSKFMPKAKRDRIVNDFLDTFGIGR